MAKFPSRFVWSRGKRLLVPLLFGIVVVVPPQAWINVTLNHGYTDSFIAFWGGDYWRFDGSLGVIVPTRKHP